MRAFFILLLISINAYASTVELYEYQSKKSIDFTALLKKGLESVLLIDESCVVCETLLQGGLISQKASLIIGTVNEPSFRWISKIKLKYKVKKLYALKPLRLDVKLGTPQLYFFNKSGKVIDQIYGKSNILKKI